MRKRIQWMVALVGLVFATTLLGGKGAKAAGNETQLPDDAFYVDYQYEEMIVECGQNTMIYYSDNSNATVWEEAERGADGKAVFDISWIKPGLTTRLYIKGDADQIPTARYIEAQEKLSAEFVGDISAADVVDIENWKKAYDNYKAFNSRSGYLLFFTKNGGAETAYFDLENIEWRKGTSGNWRPFKDLDLNQMNAKGATLYFRIKAVNDDPDNDIVGKRYSAEAKVFLQKIAAAPTVNVNNAAMSLSIRNGMEYSLDGTKWFLVPTYSKNATSDAVSVPVVDYDILPTTNRRVTTVAVPLVLGVDANEKIDADLVAANPDKYDVAKDEAGNITGIYIYVRTAAGQRKSASRIEKVLIPFTSSAPNILDDITVTYQNTKNGTSGIMITNKTNAKNGKNYQYAIVDDPDNLTPEELSELKWSTLKATKTLKVSSTRALPGMYLIFRVAAESKDELPSTYEKYPYQIQYDKVTYAAISNTSLYPGGVITAVYSNNAIHGDITYTWERSTTANGVYTPITTEVGLAGKNYTIREEDIGYYIRVVISNTSLTGETASVTSKNSGKIVKDPTAPSPTPTPTPAPGEGP